MLKIFFSYVPNYIALPSNEKSVCQWVAHTKTCNPHAIHQKDSSMKNWQPKKHLFLKEKGKGKWRTD